MSETVHLDEETYAILAELKGEDESFDEAIRRLLVERRERAREEDGYWSGDDVATVRERHERMCESAGRR